MAHRGNELGLDNRRSQSRISCDREPVFGRFALGDVVNEGDEELMLRSRERDNRRLEWELAPIRPPAAALDAAAVKAAAVFPQTLEQLHPDLGGVPGQPAGRRFGERSEGNAGDLDRCGVGHDRPAVLIEDEHALAHRADHAPRELAGVLAILGGMQARDGVVGNAHAPENNRGSGDLRVLWPHVVAAGSSR